jgi:hypothetical protein
LCSQLVCTAGARHIGRVGGVREPEVEIDKLLEIVIRVTKWVMLGSSNNDIKV